MPLLRISVLNAASISMLSARTITSFLSIVCPPLASRIRTLTGTIIIGPITAERPPFRLIISVLTLSARPRRSEATCPIITRGKRRARIRPQITRNLSPRSLPEDAVSECVCFMIISLRHFFNAGTVVFPGTVSSLLPENISVVRLHI